ncbi:MAG: CRP-like cAMP-activated global transcriptional regulator [Elusimicrobia bacterium]|nr:CRP-like cAMP-activated global transcriptional regulator [Elusimicrobiota bacterium]
MGSVRFFLSNIDPFRGLSAGDLDHLASMAQEFKHLKGETIFNEGDEAGSVWVLTQGRLEIFKYTSDGKPRAIEIINPGELFGTLCRMGGSGKTYPCTAISAVDSASYRIPDSVFLDIFRRNPSVVSGVCTLCSNRLNMMQELTCTTQEPVEKRIVRTLFQLSKTHGNTLPYTKRQIGELAATTVETTIRTLSQFQKKHWIDSSRGQIFLKNKEKLQALLQ